MAGGRFVKFGSTSALVAYLWASILLLRCGRLQPPVTAHRPAVASRRRPRENKQRIAATAGSCASARVLFAVSVPVGSPQSPLTQIYWQTRPSGSRSLPVSLAKFRPFQWPRPGLCKKYKFACQTANQRPSSVVLRPCHTTHKFQSFASPLIPHFPVKKKSVKIIVILHSGFSVCVSPNPRR